MILGYYDYVPETLRSDFCQSNGQQINRFSILRKRSTRNELPLNSSSAEFSRKSIGLNLFVMVSCFADDREVKISF